MSLKKLESHLQNSAFERDFAAVAVRLSWKSGPLSVPVGFRTTSTERAAPCRWERHYPDSGIAFKRIFSRGLEEELGPLGERYRRFVTVLELARVESFLPHFHGLPGRPVEDRAALARAFIAKAVFDVSDDARPDRAP